MPDDYVTIANYPSPVEAELARLTLEASEIHTFIVDSATAGLLSHLPALSYVRLQVHTQDVKMALEILSAETTLINDEETEVHDQAAEDKPITESTNHISECPSCGSERIELTQSLARALFGKIYAILTLSAPVLSPRYRHWRCLRCGNRWEAP